MKQKIALVSTSILVSLILFELALRVLNFPPQLNKHFQRKDIVWSMEHVSLNSYGYRDKEYQQEKSADKFRIYAVGDSYTYGWLIDNPNDTFSSIVEEELNKKYGNVEFINAASPGFTIKEEVERFTNEGKYFYPDLVLIGINDDESNVSSTYFRPSDQAVPQFLRKSHLYQATLGNLFGKVSEKKNHEYIDSIYKDPNSKDWHDFSEYLLQMKKDSESIGAKLAIILFPHIHANNPDAAYDFDAYNKKIKQFSDSNDIILIDPLEPFLKYENKRNLVINPLDPHPTIEMNKIVAEELLKKFDTDFLAKNKSTFTPKRHTVEITPKNKSLGEYKRIVSIQSNKSGYPWVYFNTSNESNTQKSPLVGMDFRQTAFHADYLETAKSFIHAGLPGAIMTYHTKPIQKGEIVIPDSLYGYEIISSSYILGLRILPDGTTKGEYITPNSFEKENDKWRILFDQKADHEIYTHNLKVAVRQLDITPSGDIQNITQTKKLTKDITQKTSKVSIPVQGMIFSWPVFNDFDKTSFSYAYVDNKLKKLKSIEIKPTSLDMEFLDSLDKGQHVSIFVSSEYQLAPDEIIKVELE